MSDILQEVRRIKRRMWLRLFVWRSAFFVWGAGSTWALVTGVLAWHVTAWWGFLAIVSGVSCAAWLLMLADSVYNAWTFSLARDEEDEKRLSVLVGGLEDPAQGLLSHVKRK